MRVPIVALSAEEVLPRLREVLVASCNSSSQAGPDDIAGSLHGREVHAKDAPHCNDVLPLALTESRLVCPQPFAGWRLGSAILK